MILETERLLLRPWEDSDAESLYEYASDPDIGPPAGWPAHRSIEESRESIRTVLSAPETYALCLKGDNRAIGAAALKLRDCSDLAQADDECELGYWIAKPFWGRGLVPEAARELLRRAFADCGMRRVWCAYYEGNEKSRRVQEKCGFRYQWTSMDVDVPLLHERRTGHVSSLTRDEWEWDRLLAAALAVQNGRKVSDYVEAGGVAAAILSGSGRIYTGVCVDTCCTLGICAERNAVFHMLTEGEQELRKVLALMPDGRCGAPCGACRELMAQLMPETFAGIEIMLDYPSERVVTLGELTPEWWVAPGREHH